MGRVAVNFIGQPVNQLIHFVQGFLLPTWLGPRLSQVLDGPREDSALLNQFNDRLFGVAQTLLVWGKMVASDFSSIRLVVLIHGPVGRAPALRLIAPGIAAQLEEADLRSDVGSVL